MSHGCHDCGSPNSCECERVFKNGIPYSVSKQILDKVNKSLNETMIYGQEKSLLSILTDYLNDEVFAKRFVDCIDMIKSKNADYTQGTAKKDRIAAFRRISSDIDIPMEKIWAIFCNKHWGAVMRFIKDGEVESEPIDGRINDIINYMVLLGAILDDKKVL